MLKPSSSVIKTFITATGAWLENGLLPTLGLPGVGIVLTSINEILNMMPKYETSIYT